MCACERMLFEESHAVVVVLVIMRSKLPLLPLDFSRDLSRDLPPAVFGGDLYRPVLVDDFTFLITRLLAAAVFFVPPLFSSTAF